MSIDELTAKDVLPGPSSEADTSEAAATVAHQIIIEPRKGWLGINFREIWQHRELLFFLTWRDVKIRYKQTVLGFLWAERRFQLIVVLG